MQFTSDFCNLIYMHITWILYKDSLRSVENTECNWILEDFSEQNMWKRSIKSTYIFEMGTFKAYYPFSSFTPSFWRFQSRS